MAGSFKADKQVFIFPSQFYRQDDFFTALDDSVIDKRHPQLDPTFAVKERTRTTRFDCNGVDIIDEELNTELARKRFRFPATTELLTGWLAMSYGAITAPSGVPANEVQTLQESATLTAGTYTITFNLEGITDTTDPLAYDANAATVQAALNGLRSISRGGTGNGSVTVTGDIVAGFVVTFLGRLAKGDMPALSVNSASLVGGVINVTETTKGTNKIHVGSRAISDVLPYTSFIEAFIGDLTAALEWYGFAVDGIVIEADKGGDLFVTVDLIGRADSFEVTPFAIPACINTIPINTKDCRLKVDGAFVAAGLSRFRFERRNNIITSVDAFFFDSPDLETNERDIPTETASYAVRGSRGDSHYTNAEAETEHEVIFMLGKPGERVNIIIPEGNLKLGNPPIGFDAARKSIINVDVQPYLDATLQASSNFEANIARTTQFITTAP